VAAKIAPLRVFGSGHNSLPPQTLRGAIFAFTFPFAVPACASAAIEAEKERLRDTPYLSFFCFDSGGGVAIFALEWEQSSLSLSRHKKERLWDTPYLSFFCFDNGGGVAIYAPALGSMFYSVFQ